jgi:predicted nucleotidyltransferase
LNEAQGNAMKTKARKKQGKPDPAILSDIVKAVVRAAKPEKIVLFGSAARGEMGPNSDYDLLVIKAGKFNRHRVTTAIYHHLSGEAAVDAVVVTPEEVERYRDTHCLVICPALKEGKVVYDSQAPSAGRSSRMAESSARPLARASESGGLIPGLSGHLFDKS